jgi:nitroreductase
MKSDNFVPYTPISFMESPEERSKNFYEFMDKRRSVREFSDKPISKEVIDKLILTASSAPSGAHKQPWTFCAVSSADIKQKIREAAEKEEYENYHGRMSEDWLEDLKQFGTDWHKSFLTTAPWLIVVFKKAYDLVDGEKQKNYYVNESVGLATGFLLAAIHQAGFVSLTHTPSPLNFLQKILDRPSNERPFLLIPVGYPADNAEVPVLERKGLDKMAVFY